MLTADPGDFSGTPEARFILDNLRNARSKPRGSSVCASLIHGMLMGQRMVVVTTGKRERMCCPHDGSWGQHACRHGRLMGQRVEVSKCILCMHTCMMGQGASM